MVEHTHTHSLVITVICRDRGFGFSFSFFFHVFHQHNCIANGEINFVYRQYIFSVSEECCGV